MSHLRSLITQCCHIGASDDLALTSSIEAAIAQAKGTSKRLGIWLPNGNVTTLAQDIALRLSAHTSQPSAADILGHYLSFFAAGPYQREMQRIRQDLEQLPNNPRQLHYRKFVSSFGALNWKEKLSHDCWTFWRAWYQGFLEGQPIDWDLQRRIALIGDAVWDAGPEAVAAEIERIRAEFSAPRAGKERFPKHEPKSVSHLIENRIISSASLQGLAAQVTHSIDRFHAETGANALPDALEPLTALPALLLAVTSAIQNALSSETIASETEDQLRAEVGRLNAKVAELEGKISGLEAVIASLPKSEHKGILHLLAQTALWGSLAGGLWMLSGEDADLRKRYESLIERKEQIRGLLMRDGLPQTQVEKSLRPAARPGRA
ncbi:hypothetical protein [Leisingera sp. M658]|uniref:hypothetical protein n=1 Tax=Leisingera sp. M658 TaxID=2867015 RepID=UPI0021A51E86|nr:hypothetical protein [Leisingera sp. M658]UWQ76039.1 hypothetical protein K3724_06270 [Leisingera sp. M658]